MSAPKNNHKRPVFGFYWRKVAFFAFLFSLFAFSISAVNTFRADTNGFVPSDSENDLKVDVAIKKDGSVLIDGKKISERVKTINGKDELILPLFDNVGISYDTLTATMTLPKSVANMTTHDIKGIHGVDAVNSYVLDNQTLVFSADGIGPAAEVSLIIEMPAGSVNPPLAYRLYSLINNIRSSAWLITAVGLPLFTLVFMFLFIAYQARRQKIDRPEKESDMPPMALPPALVGVLYRQKVTAREIAATLIDLALRGDIYIVDRERDFAFAKNRFDQRLLSYEKMLLSKIFRQNLVSNREEIEKRINSHLYSRKISLVSAGVYVLATRLGYFQANPQKTHLRYQLAGMAFFFVGVAGFILSLIFFPSPSYAAFFWVGMLISGLIITFTAGNIPNRTPLGQESLSNWLAFRKFLTNPEKIPFDYNAPEIFEKYLPYAIVMDCEVAWAKRFSEQNFVLPDWFVSDRSGLGLQDFCLSLFPLVSYVARSLAAIKEPGFD